MWDKYEAGKIKKLVEYSENKNDNCDSLGNRIQRCLREDTTYDSLLELFRYMTDISLFVAGREYMKLAGAAGHGESDEYGSMLREIAEKMILIKAEEELEAADKKICCKALVALFAVGAEDRCRDFFRKKKESAPSYIYLLQELFHFTDLDCRKYDMYLFWLRSLEDLDDYTNNKCIRALRLDIGGPEAFLEQKEQEIRALAQWYYQKDYYISLGALLRMLEFGFGRNGYYKRQAYNYIGAGGIEKEDFLSRLYASGSAKALELYLNVKYPDDFPAADEVKNFLDAHFSGSGIFCILIRCLKEIHAGSKLDAAKEVLALLSDKIGKGELAYYPFEEFCDRGIENGRLKWYIVQDFDRICQRGRDVKDTKEFFGLVREFLDLIAWFNIYRNDYLDMDYNDLPKDAGLHLGWRETLDILSARSSKDPEAFVYIVMNSYLKFYVDIFGLYEKFPEEVRKYYILGLVKNTRIALLPSNTKPRFYYAIKLVEEDDSSIKTNSEKQLYIRFKVSRVAENEMSIVSAETIVTQFGIKMNEFVSGQLLKENYHQVYYYLKSLEGTELNMFSNKRFDSSYRDVRLDQETEAKTERNKRIREKLLAGMQKNELLREQISYIYLNSYLRVVIKPEELRPVLGKTEYLMGNIRLVDQLSGENTHLVRQISGGKSFPAGGKGGFADLLKRDEEYFYIWSVYYNPDKVLFRIRKEDVRPVELFAYIENQLDWSRDEWIREQGDINSPKYSIRVFFSVEEQAWQDSGSIQASEIKFVCDDRMVEDLASALKIFHEVCRTNPRGIKKMIAGKYLAGYGRGITAGDGWYNGEWEKFFRLYFKYLNHETGLIFKMQSSKLLDRWVTGESGDVVYYNKYNLFFNLHGKLFLDEHRKYKVSMGRELRKKLQEDQNYKAVIRNLKACPVELKEAVYDITILRAIFESYREDAILAVQEFIAVCVIFSRERHVDLGLEKGRFRIGNLEMALDPACLETGREPAGEAVFGRQGLKGEDLSYLDGTIFCPKLYGILDDYEMGNEKGDADVAGELYELGKDALGKHGFQFVLIEADLEGNSEGNIRLVEKG